MTLETFENHVNSQFPFLRNSLLIVAISGGIDSVVLTYLSHKLSLNIVLAHCNFKLRRTESDADEDFVNQFAKTLNLNIYTKTFDTENYVKNHKLSIQMAARSLRYEWFKTLSSKLKSKYTLTAHHADDNLETFLINLSRGTGIEGLTGIPAMKDGNVRPLLPFSRVDIEAFAKANQLKWREDSSNTSTQYIRNAMRRNVIPQLKHINPHFLTSFNHTVKHLKGVVKMVNDSTEVLKKECVIVESDCQKIDIQKLMLLQNPKPYLFELLKDYGFTQWDDIYRLLQSQSGKQVSSKTHRLIRNRSFLLLTELNENTKNSITNITTLKKPIMIPSGILNFEVVDVIGELDKSIVYIDKSLLKLPLIVRPWKQGDVFYPIGMKGKKKISKYFKDEKLSLLEKEKSLLLCSQGQIVWVIGKRPDRRFKVTTQTTTILKLRVTTSSQR